MPLPVPQTGGVTIHLAPDSTHSPRLHQDDAPPYSPCRMAELSDRSPYRPPRMDHLQPPNTNQHALQVNQPRVGAGPSVMGPSQPDPSSGRQTSAQPRNLPPSFAANTPRQPRPPQGDNSCGSDFLGGGGDMVFVIFANTSAKLLRPQIPSACLVVTETPNKKQTLRALQPRGRPPSRA